MNVELRHISLISETSPEKPQFGAHDAEDALRPLAQLIARAIAAKNLTGHMRIDSVEEDDE